MPREWCVGYTARIFDRHHMARAAFAAARAILEKQLREKPDNALNWTLLGRVKAALGEKQEAIEAGQRACELWPLSREPGWALKLSDISRSFMPGSAKKTWPCSN